MKVCLEFYSLTTNYPHDNDLYARGGGGGPFYIENVFAKYK